MAFKNVHHSWKMLETVTRGDAHFSMTYLGSELNHTLFVFGHLIPINILIAQIITPIIIIPSTISKFLVFKNLFIL